VRIGSVVLDKGGRHTSTVVEGGQGAIALHPEQFCYLLIFTLQI